MCNSFTRVHDIHTHVCVYNMQGTNVSTHLQTGFKPSYTGCKAKATNCSFALAQTLTCTVRITTTFMMFVSMRKVFNKRSTIFSFKIKVKIDCMHFYALQFGLP